MSRAKRWFCKIGGCLERGPRGGPRGGPEFRGCLRRNACFRVPLAGIPRMSRAGRVPRAGISRMSRLIRLFCQDFLELWQDVSSETLILHSLWRMSRAKRWFCTIEGDVSSGGLVECQNSEDVSGEMLVFTSRSQEFRGCLARAASRAQEF